VSKVSEKGSGLYQYYIKVVPTSYTPLRGEPLVSCQYSVTEALRPIASESGRPSSEFILPGVFFIYDLSPIKVTYTEETTSFWTFMTSLCAIIGGVFVVAGMVDAAVYSMEQGRALAL
jgi:hypothetical protein